MRRGDLQTPRVQPNRRALELSDILKERYSLQEQESLHEDQANPIESEERHLQLFEQLRPEQLGAQELGDVLAYDLQKVKEVRRC